MPCRTVDPEGPGRPQWPTSDDNIDGIGIGRGTTLVSQCITVDYSWVATDPAILSSLGREVELDEGGRGGWRRMGGMVAPTTPTAPISCLHLLHTSAFASPEERQIAQVL